jgi:hypothetical protein
MKGSDFSTFTTIEEIRARSRAETLTSPIVPVDLAMDETSEGAESTDDSSSLCSSGCSSFADDDDDGEVERVTSLRIDRRRPSTEEHGLLILHEDIFVEDVSPSTSENNEEGINYVVDDEDAHFMPTAATPSRQSAHMLL